ESARLFDEAGMRGAFITQLDEVADVHHFATQGDVRNEFAFGRFYASGSAIGVLLDDLDAGDWRSACKKAISPYEFASSLFANSSDQAVAAAVAGAQVAHDYEAIVALANRIVALPPGQP